MNRRSEAPRAFRSLVGAVFRLGALTAMFLTLLPPAIATAEDVDVLIADTLRPAQLTVAPGTTITFVNQDGERHRVRSVSGPAEFDSGNLEQGATYSVTLTADGTYEYVDDRDRHNEAYHGSITVTTGDPPSGGTEPDPAPGAPAPLLSGDVSIVDRVYRPASIEVGVGATVSFVNNDDRAHTVTATDGSWDSGIFDTGGSYRRSFGSAGAFSYFCTIHPDMRGEVVVVATPGSFPPPAPEPTPHPSSPTTTVPPAPAGPAGISIVDFGFEPGSRAVAAGTTVTWTNVGAAPHTVAATGGAFESGFLITGDTFANTFATPGSFSYFCTLHPAMRGTIVVTGATTGSSPPPTAEPTPSNSLPDPGSPRRPTGPSDISIIDNAFSPLTRTIATGATLRWTNGGNLPHTVTARDSSFDSGFLSPGGSFQRTFVSPGVFDYFCTIHPGMKGVITVVGSATASSSDPPSVNTSVAPAALDGAATGPSAVTIIDNDFQPGMIEVAVGAVVSWTNTGSLPHTVTAADGSFDSGFLMTGDGYSLTTTSPGLIEYFCAIHPGMVGAINVTTAGSEPGPAEGPIGSISLEGGSDGPQTGIAPSDASTDSRIRVVDLAYQPGTLTIELGSSVLWVNEGALPHTVTARDGTSDSGILAAADVYQQTFEQVGRFEYFCTLHPDMVGVINVRAPVSLAAALPAGPPEPVSIWFAVILAASILIAMVAFVVGMNRFSQVAERER